MRCITPARAMAGTGGGVAYADAWPYPSGRLASKSGAGERAHCAILKPVLDYNIVLQPSTLSPAYPSICGGCLPVVGVPLEAPPSPLPFLLHAHSIASNGHSRRPVAHDGHIAAVTVTATAVCGSPPARERPPQLLRWLRVVSWREWTGFRGPCAHVRVG